jgi:hypothetical protein
MGAGRGAYTKKTTPRKSTGNARPAKRNYGPNANVKESNLNKRTMGRK